jgi:hypothetical protein
MGRRKSSVITDIAYELLQSGPRTSHDIYDAIRATGYHYLPTVREVTFALKADRRFRQVDKVVVGTALRSRSHSVALWGLNNNR